MSEHFNIAVVFEPPEYFGGNIDVVLSLKEIYSQFFGDINEVCLDNYETASSVCEKWPEGETLLKAGVGDDELLVIYGDKLGKFDGARSSLHFQENDFCKIFLISLPLEPNTALSHLEPYLLRTRDFAERLSGSFVVAAGWELECDIDEKIEGVLRDCLSDKSLCLWLATHKRLISSLPKKYSKAGESDQTILYRRT